MKNPNVSDLDHRHAQNRMFDQDNDAQRVVIVGGGLSLDGQINASSNQIQTVEVPTIVKEIQVIEIPVIQKEVQIVEVEKQVIVKEFERIEVPLVVETVRMIEIEKPVVITETKVIEVEKLVVVKEPTALPEWVKYVLYAQTLALFLNVIVSLLRK